MNRSHFGHSGIEEKCPWPGGYQTPVTQPCLLNVLTELSSFSQLQESRMMFIVFCSVPSTTNLVLRSKMERSEQQLSE